ncbi:hypothetical protein [Nocardiopsis sp. FIRDI 009]|uniref:hypothetical protein n=1 Tax=Nocardiopsis sp. FIRDI 009 TaxID=714197 RepID=UPI000E25EADA|nr:hypothetical protein [Nocardiopsis sp. FIRDI 009]
MNSETAVDQALEALRDRHGDRYVITRVGRLWKATDRDPNTTTEPTLVEDTPTALEERMRAPGPRVAVPYQREVR